MCCPPLIVLISIDTSLYCIVKLSFFISSLSTVSLSLTSIWYWYIRSLFRITFSFQNGSDSTGFATWYFTWKKWAVNFWQLRKNLLNNKKNIFKCLQEILKINWNLPRPLKTTKKMHFSVRFHRHQLKEDSSSKRTWINCTKLTLDSSSVELGLVRL